MRNCYTTFVLLSNLVQCGHRFLAIREASDTVDINCFDTCDKAFTFIRGYRGLVFHVRDVISGYYPNEAPNPLVSTISLFSLAEGMHAGQHVLVISGSCGLLGIETYYKSKIAFAQHKDTYHLTLSIRSLMGGTYGV